MVIVVPAFAERDERHQGAVLALISGLVANATNDVAERIDAEGCMVGDHGADKEASDHTTPPCNQIAEYSKCQTGNPVVAVEPAEFGVLAEVTDGMPIGVRVFW